MKRKLWTALFSVSLALSLAFGGAGAFAQDNMLWIDVRSASEYQADHLSGAINIEHTGIVDGLQQRGIGKDAAITLYCGSGRRAGIARDALLQAGYTRVSNAGGLKDARALAATAADGEK